MAPEKWSILYPWKPLWRTAKTFIRPLYLSCDNSLWQPQRAVLQKPLTGDQVRGLQQIFIIRNFTSQFVIINRIRNELYGLLLMPMRAAGPQQMWLAPGVLNSPVLMDSTGSSVSRTAGFYEPFTFYLSVHTFFHPSACYFTGTLSPSTPVVTYTAHSHKLTPKGFLPLTYTLKVAMWVKSYCTRNKKLLRKEHIFPVCFSVKKKNLIAKSFLFIIWPIVSAIPIFLVKHIPKINVLSVVLFCKGCL